MLLKKTTPTTEQLTPFTNPQETAVGGTEEFVDYAKEQGTRDVAVPVGHNTQYKKLPAEWDDDYMLWLQEKAENALQQGWHDSFENLSDTSFSNLANGQIPKWNSTSQKWENANATITINRVSKTDPTMQYLDGSGTGQSTMQFDLEVSKSDLMIDNYAFLILESITVKNGNYELPYIITKFTDDKTAATPKLYVNGFICSRDGGELPTAFLTVTYNLIFIY